MPLHSRRRRLAELAEREATGDSFWTDGFSERARTRIQHVITGLSEYWWMYAEEARLLILADEGWQSLGTNASAASQDFVYYLATGPDEMMPTVIEAFNESLKDRQILSQLGARHSDTFVTLVNEILREERVSWEFVGQEMTPFSSRELHVEVVAPTLRLLTKPGWERVETAYQSALSELSSDNAPDAITDAGTALQEALSMAGAEGNALGPLISSARSKGIILGHDQALFETVARAATWVSADRSQLGDAHLVSSADHDDAWLTVHIVGAILLRISAQSHRPD